MTKLTGTDRCEDKVEGKLDGMMKRVREALRADEGESFRENDMYACSVRAIQVRVITSGGGPADGFDFYVDPEDGETLYVKYYYHEWGDGATRQLFGSDLEYVEELFGEEVRWAVRNSLDMEVS